MRRTLLLSIYCLLLSIDATAQQLPLFTQYRDNWTQINPASLYNGYINYEHDVAIGISHRQQWTDPDLIGAPITTMAQFQYVVEDYNFFTGGYILNDQTGHIGTTGVYGNFAYQIPLGKGRIDQTLSVGISGGLVQYSVDIPDGLATSNNSSSLFSEKIFYPDFGAGLFYHYDEKFYAGVSIPQLFGLNLEVRNEENPASSFSLVRVRHYYAVIGGYFDFDFLDSETAFFEPSIWIRYVDNVPLSFDVNFRYKPSDYFWLGLGYGSATVLSTVREQMDINPGKHILHLEAGITLPYMFNPEGNLKIGFGYDVQLSEYLNSFGNSFEIHVIYSWER